MQVYNFFLTKVILFGVNNCDGGVLFFVATIFWLFIDIYYDFLLKKAKLY